MSIGWFFCSVSRSAGCSAGSRRGPSKRGHGRAIGLLFVLGQRDGVLMGEAGAALDLGPPGISGLFDRMTAANLIRRRADPDDGRRGGSG